MRVAGRGRANFKEFTSEKACLTKRGAKSDAADVACFWFAFGRVLEVAAGLPFEGTPGVCVVRTGKGKEREKVGVSLDDRSEEQLGGVGEARRKKTQFLGLAHQTS